MAIYVSEPQGTYEPLPEGMYMAICYLVADVGEQWQEGMNGREGRWARRVIIGWEVQDEFIETEGVSHPRTVHNFYSAQLHKQGNLRPMLENWRGKSFSSEELARFDLCHILGAGCQIQIKHRTKKNGSTGEEISIMALPRGVKLGEPSRRIEFSVERDMSRIEDMPKVVQSMVAKCRMLTEQEDPKPFGDYEEAGGYADAPFPEGF